MAVATVERRIPVPYEEIDGVRYPWAEEKSVVQGDWHGWTLHDAIDMIGATLRDRPAARIYTDVFLYWEKGSPSKRQAPDLFVLPEVAQLERQRKSVKLWEERSRPIFVLEVLSDSTAHEDLGDKYDVYQDEIQVPEYFVCDPFPLPVRVRGYRLAEGVYVSIDRDEAGRVWSEQLQVWFGAGDNGMLRVWDAQGEEVPTYAEARRRAEDQARRAEDEARAREAAEARVRELEEALRRAGAGP